MCIGIIAVNTCIYLLWQVPGLSRFMMKWFLTSQTGGLMWLLFLSLSELVGLWSVSIPASSLTLLTSSFSHMNFWHLFLNMYVFWNFHYLFEKFMSAEAFLAFYVTAG
jgi:rhomboid-like protein